MKGIVYQALNKFVEDNLGAEAWEETLITVAPKSEGVYTAVSSYDTQEFFDLLLHVCNKNNLDVSQTVFNFGVFLFPLLADKYYIFVMHVPGLKYFIKSIDDVIHVEVRKLYPDAELPSMQYIELPNGNLLLTYYSPRKLCILAEGLIHGAAKHFNEKVSISQKACMHSGAKACKLEIEFVDE